MVEIQQNNSVVATGEGKVVFVPDNEKPDFSEYRRSKGGKTKKYRGNHRSHVRGAGFKAIYRSGRGAGR